MSPAARRTMAGAAAGIIGLLFLLSLPLVGLFGGGYLRNFRVANEGMAPAFENGDSLIARMDGARQVKRGDVILLAVDGTTYIKRIAAVAGDTIGLKSGVVVLNGSPVAQRLLATQKRSGMDGMESARRLAEQFPGEAAPHEILDIERSPSDDFAETAVPPGFVFVLGDNRDRSADSRVPRVEAGVEILPLADIQGWPVYCTRGCVLGR